MVKTGYKQTEIGLIPEDWEVDYLGNKTIKIASGKSNTTNEENGVYKIFGSTGVIGYKKNYDYKGQKITVARVGANAGTINLIDGEYCISDNTLFIEANNLLNIKFLKYHLDNSNLNQYIFGSGQPLITGTILKNLQIPLPPLPEQTAIAEALSDADAWIESLEQLIAKKRLIKQGAMQTLLTPNPSTGSGDWEVKKLGECLSYIQPTQFLVKSTEYNQNNNIPVLTAGKTFVLGYTDEEFGVFDKLPTIIFDDFTTASKYVDFPFKAKSSAMKMLVLKNTQNDLRFLFETLQNLKFQVGDHKRHWIGEFQNIEVMLPSIAEQTRIATILSDMDAELDALEAQLEKAKQIKQGMMQELLTGRVRLV